MGKIVVSENVTLDGVIEDPTGDEGFRFGGWFAQMSERDREAWGKIEFDQALGAAALLMGGRTYHYFVAKGWAERPGDWAGRLRDLPKYVVSSTLRDPTWANTAVLTGDVVTEVAKLAATIDGEIVLYGSRKLVHLLMEHKMVDEVRLIVHPFVLGRGDRLFGETTNSTPVRLMDIQKVGDGLAQLFYRVDT
jgi:dihydrofolate reductase